MICKVVLRGDNFRIRMCELAATHISVVDELSESCTRAGYVTNLAPGCLSLNLFCDSSVKDEISELRLYFPSQNVASNMYFVKTIGFEKSRFGDDYLRFDKAMYFIFNHHRTKGFL